MTTRRDWLLGAAALGSAAWLPAAQGARQALDGRRLVLVELAGANDGLNTVVPRQDERYRELRPTIALPDDDLLVLPGGRSGLHGSLAPLMPALDAGEMAIVQGLGYPRPNRSHFASIEYWNSGGDGESGSGRQGWSTHDVEHSLGRIVRDAHGISLDGPIGPLQSGSGRWLSAASVAQLATLQSIAPGAAPSRAGDAARDPIERMRQRMQQVDRSLAQLQQRIEHAPQLPAFRGGALGEQLREVARFVLAGLDTPVYRVRLTGFDTHSNQRGRHASLLRQLALGVADFRKAMLRAGEWRQSVVMTYSEFGRRAAENQSGGTDHGTAAPHLVLGGQLAGGAGLLGQAPDLSNLVDLDPVATLDYRALYERVLAGWLGATDNRFAAYRDPALATLFG